jgi:hypothetical protein
MHTRIRARLPRPVAAVAALTLALSGAAGLTFAASGVANAAGSVSSTVDPLNGFPIWYQDSAGNRVEPCLDPNDANCALPAGTAFDASQPVVFPTNFPDEFFYSSAASQNVATPGCAGTAPGRAQVALALEGAFVNGDPVAGEQMVFGRIRVRVTSGLCPNTTYRFRHPFGTETLTTDEAGAIVPNAGTQDVGCAPVPPGRCDFSLANGSRVMGGATVGFLRWDTGAPAGYLGDGATAHTITGGTAGNDFAILDSVGNDLGLNTNQFVVAGKLAGSLTASSRSVDFGGQDVSTTSATKTVTVTNLDKATVTPSAATITGTDAAQFSVATGTDHCSGRALTRDQTCTIGLTFSPTAPAGKRTASLVVPSTGGVHSPLTVALTGTGTNVGAAPVLTKTTPSLAFGSVRVRTESPEQIVTITNSGTAPLGITDVQLDPNTSEGADYLILADTCATGTTVPAGGTCTLRVRFAPLTVGAHPTQILLDSNAASSPDSIPLTGTGIGGVAAAGPVNPANGFTQWYRDENGVTLQQCLDPADANCILAPDEFFDINQPEVFPTNFPSEFFYQLATSDNVATAGCNGSAPGRALLITGVEGAFVNAGPVPGEQITFGRIRLTVTGGLCPGQEYSFVTPYGITKLVANADGGIARKAGTEDIGCTPVAPDTCDFTVALGSRVFASFLRWDPAVAPAAPAGYIGDGNTLHKVTGAPYSPDGITPANYFQINDSTGAQVGKTDVFAVVGKLQGPLEADPAKGDLGVVPIGDTSPEQTVQLKNTGITPLTVTSASVTGVDAADFTATATACVGTTLAPGASCSVSLSFSPTATGDRTASLTVRHTGLNDPFVVPLVGTGGAAGTTAAISFNPRSVAFTPLHVGKTSKLWTVNISNAGGTLPLDVQSVTLNGTGAAQFAILDNRCTANVAPGASCQVDLAFAPTGAGNFSAGMLVVDNAPGNRHTLALTGTGTTATPAVSAAVDSDNHYPRWYQDSTGTRVEACLDIADPNCVVLGDQFYDPNQPQVFPSNFPGEFFYGLADSQLVSTPGCGGTTPGIAQLRVTLEGAFANTAPADGDQITFARLRVNVTSGLCPNTPYVFETPYGVINFATDGAGAVSRNAGTVDTGCSPTAPATCDFSQALLADSRIGPNGDTFAQSFLRWDPAEAASPDGYLGDARAFHKVVGGTYVPPGTSQPVNKFAIFDTAGNDVGHTDLFTVSGKIAGPLQTDVASVDFGHQPTGATSGNRVVTVTNVAPTSTPVSAIALHGANSGDFRITGGTCAGATVPTDGACTVTVAFAPAAAGTKNATLSITPAGTGPAAVVGLTGIADPASAPVATVTPGALAYGTVTAGTPSTLSTTVKNTGTAPLVVSAPTITGTGATAYSVTANTCTTVAPNATCTISVRYAPTALGSQVGNLVIPHNATGGSTTVSLTGAGAGSSFTLAPNPISFGTIDINRNKTQTVTVKNVGTVAGPVSTATITGTNAANFTVTGTGCIGTTLQPTKTCNLTVTFRPTAAQAYSANLVVGGNATTVPATVQDAMTGSGK